MSDKENPKCDRCEQPATMVGYNYIEIRQSSGKIDHDPMPEPFDRNYGCNNHPVEGNMAAAVSEPWRYRF